MKILIFQDIFILDCSRYFECEPMNGHCLYECDASLYFDPVLNVCNWPSQVNCTMVEPCQNCESWQTCNQGMSPLQSYSLFLTVCLYDLC